LSEPAAILIEAPMGEGKTEAALLLADRLAAAAGQRGFYFGLPTQATSNQLFTRVCEFLDQRYRDFNGTSPDAFIALGAALKEGLPIRSIEQSWFVYPEAPGVPVGPQWRITFWRKATVSQ
jgi:hypothetical protein